MDGEKYRHEHEKSSDWFRENFLEFTHGADRKHRDVHHHKIVNEATGKTGEGWGWSYGQAKEKAWEDLNGY